MTSQIKNNRKKFKLKLKNNNNKNKENNEKILNFKN